MTKTGSWRSSGTAVITANNDIIGFGLDDAGSNGTDTGTGSQFNTDTSIAVGIFLIKNEFC